MASHPVSLQHKMVFMEVNQPLFPHPGKLQRKPASLHGKVVGHLLAGKRDVKFHAPALPGGGGKIGKQLGPCRPLRDMRQFFIISQILCSQI